MILFPCQLTVITVLGCCAHFRTIMSLKSRNGIYITKPDKGSGVVILNKQDYIKKKITFLNHPCNTILDDPKM